MMMPRVSVGSNHLLYGEGLGGLPGGCGLTHAVLDLGDEGGGVVGGLDPASVGGIDATLDGDASELGGEPCEAEVQPAGVARSEAGHAVALVQIDRDHGDVCLKEGLEGTHPFAEVPSLSASRPIMKPGTSTK